MSSNRRKGTKRITAGELLKKLKSSPKYRLNRAKALKRIRNAQKEADREFEKKFKPALLELEKIGVTKHDLYTAEGKTKIYANKELFSQVQSILLRWFPKVDDGIKETIVRFLSVPWSPLSTARLFINEFKKAPKEAKLDLKWAIGNALHIFANDEVFDDIVDIATDRRHGSSREMVVASLMRMKNPKAVDVLIKLLDDEDVAGHALKALRRLNAKRARKYIEPFLEHPRTWWRNEAKKAIKKFDKAK